MLIVGVVNAGEVNVLLVNVSVPVKVAKVKVPVGIVIVPLFDIEAITGAVKVLLVSVSVEEVVTISIPSIDTLPAEARARVVSVA